VKKYFLTGLVTLLPLAVTFWILNFLIRLLTNPFQGFVTSFINSFPAYANHVPKQATRFISEILILITLLLITLFLGFVARRFFFSQIIKLGDTILSKVPLVNKVYKTSKDLVLSLFNPQKHSFKQVVLLKFPHSRSYCLGLVTSDAPLTCSDPLKQNMVSIFIPTTPNPTTGYLILCKKEELIYLKMKSEDAIKYIVSCAVVQPSKEPV